MSQMLQKFGSFRIKKDSKEKEEKTSSNESLPPPTSRRNSDEGPKVKTKFTPSEEDLLKEMFIIIVNNGIIREARKWYSTEEELDQFNYATVNLSLTTGTALKLLHHFISLDIESNPSTLIELDSKSTANVMVKLFLHKLSIGNSYLKEVLCDFLSQAVFARPDKVIELNKKNTSKESIQKEIEFLSEKFKSFIQLALSQEMINKLPTQIRVLLSLVTDIAAKYHPKNIQAYVASVLSGFIIPAILSPLEFGVVPDAKSLTPVNKKNLSIIAAIFRQLCLGQEFEKKKAAASDSDLDLRSMNDFISTNKWKLESLMKAIVANARQLPASVVMVASSVPFSSNADLIFFNKMIVLKKEQLDRAFQTHPNTAIDFNRMLSKFNKFDSLSNFLENPPLSPTSSLLSLDQMFVPYYTLRVVIETGDKIYEESVISDPTAISLLAKKFSKKLKKASQGKSSGLTKGSPLTTPKNSLRRSRTPMLHSPTYRESRNLEIVEKANPNAIFGKPLQQIVESQRVQFPETKVPKFLSELIKILLTKGLQEEGIFRQSGNQSTILEYKDKLDRGETLSLKREYNLHNISGLIKLYFRELPDPLLSFKLYDQFVAVSKIIDQDERITVLRKIIMETLPQYNRAVLHEIVRLLHLISTHSAVNRMNASNLSIAFGPTLLKSADDIQKFEKNTQVQSVIQEIIESYHDIFKSYIAEELANSKSVAIWNSRIFAHTRSIMNLVLMEEDTICSSSTSIFKVWIPESLEPQLEIDVKQYILCMLPVHDFIWISTEKGIEIWDPKSGKRKTSIEEDGVSSMTLVGQDFVWTNSIDKQMISIYETSEGGLQNEIDTKENINLVEYVGDDRVWGATTSNSIVIWDAKSHNQVAEITGIHKRKINCILRVEESVWTCSDDQLICVIDIRTKNNNILKKIEAHEDRIIKMALLGTMLWTCSRDMSIKVWDIKSYQPVEELIGYHTDTISGVVFPFNSKKKAYQAWSSSFDGTISLFSLTPLALSRSRAASWTRHSIKPPIQHRNSYLNRASLKVLGEST